jgi:MarR family transcriptional regulator, organic hydroperoxide resistance regulator
MKQTISTGELARMILETFPSIMRKLMHGIHRKVKDSNLNKSQYRTLFLVHYHKESTMGEISRHMNMEKGSFTGVVDSLIEQGLLKRKQDGQDRRKVNLEISEEGLRVIKKVEGMLYRELEKKLEVLTEKDREKFLHAVRDLHEMAEKLPD